MTPTGQAFTLLNPGPVNVSERVRAALAEAQDQCHREREYLDLQANVRATLASCFGVSSSHDPILLTGSGTAAMEAMVASCVGRGLAVVENGIYGTRLAAIAEAHRIPVRRIAASWLERPDPGRVEAALDGSVDALAVVHHETTTGLLNDLPTLAEIARRKGVRFLVDSVSGLGGETFDWQAIDPDAVCATANKCIQGLPGVSFVLARRGLSFERRSVYLDLESLLASQSAGGTPFTPAIQVMAAFGAALEELAEEGVAARAERYAAAAQGLRAALARQDLTLLVPEALRSRTITCSSLPPGVGYEALHSGLRARGFVIYAGLGALFKEAFRVANMGWIPPERIEAFGGALAEATHEARGG